MTSWGSGLKMPGQVPKQIAVLVANLEHVSWHAIAIGALTIALVYAWPFITSGSPPALSQ